MSRFGPALVAAFMLAPPGARAVSFTHGLDCRDFKSKPRAAEICIAIGRHLSWQWMGHAVPAPGFKPSFTGLRKTYCQARISKDDLPVLNELRSYVPPGKKPDWRLESAASMLITLIENQDGQGSEPRNSVFNPLNPDYVLKGGCPKA